MAWRFYNALGQEKSAGATGVTGVSGAIPRVVALTDAATIVVDVLLGNIFTVTLGGNRTMGNPSNGVNGDRILFRIKQDGTGARILTWDTNYRFSDDITIVTLSTIAARQDYILFIYNSVDTKWDCLGAVKGFA